MSVSSPVDQPQKLPSEYEFRVSDEQKWKDSAEEEFEVSSNHSPMKNYTPEFLKQINWRKKGSGGERGIRTPVRLLAWTRFPGVRLKPLIHLSAGGGIISQLMLHTKPTLQGLSAVDEVKFKLGTQSMEISDSTIFVDKSVVLCGQPSYFLPNQSDR